MSVIIKNGDRTIIRKKSTHYFKLYNGYAIQKCELDKIKTKDIVLIIENEDKTEDAYITTPEAWRKGIPHKFKDEEQVIMSVKNMTKL
jgi:hypothetical protein